MAIFANEEKEICEERRSLLYSECASSTSSALSNISDILHNNQRLIFKYPDGTYAYAFKQPKNKGEDDCDNWLQYKPNNGVNQVSQMTQE